MAVLMTNGTFLLSTPSRTHLWTEKDIKFLMGPNSCCGVSLRNSTTLQNANLPHDHRICVFKLSTVSSARRIKCFQHEDSETDETPAFMGNPEGQDKAGNAVLPILPAGKSSDGTGRSFLTTLVILLGIALALTLLSIGSRQRPNHQGSFFGIECLADGSSSSDLSAYTGGFSFRVFGYRFLLPEYAPGWIYFWLLMAAGCGLFISEEALNIWIGINLSRLLSFDGSWQSFVDSFSRNAHYIVSTVLWVYWGVCISDMVPFYLVRNWQRDSNEHNKGGAKIWKFGWFCRAFFSRSEKPNSFPGGGNGHIA